MAFTRSGVRSPLSPPGKRLLRQPLSFSGYCVAMNARHLERVLRGAMLASLMIAADAAADEKLAKTTIETNPAGATVQVDGAEQATRTPMTVSLARGRHVVSMRSPDRQTERRA